MTATQAPTPAVLLMVFNRPAQTEQAVYALLREKPARLYVSGDGPRTGNPTDQSLIAEVWRIIRSVPWECEVFERQLTENIGCGPGVRSGIDWFFASEERGLIVEDDVVLGPGALALAGQLFDIGESSPDIGAISLLNCVPDAQLRDPQASYRRSIFSSSQGWGTWAPIWQRSARSLDQWRTWLPPARLRAIGGRHFQQRWQGILDTDYASGALTWDYTWQAALWAAGLDTLVANRNLIANTGFTPDASFSIVPPSWWPHEIQGWEPPMIAPPADILDAHAEKWEANHRYQVSALFGLRSWTANRIPRVTAAYRNRRYRSS
ncbi:MAG: hypothetical protein Q7L55_10105 [Actinomycetota bacterium]|nr:hypothetical protein [Actinomycetota bacterium]